MEAKQRKMAMVAKQVKMDEYDQDLQDMAYWSRKSPHERGATVTFLVNQTLKSGQRMDKTKFSQILING